MTNIQFLSVSVPHQGEPRATIQYASNLVRSAHERINNGATVDFDPDTVTDRELIEWEAQYDMAAGWVQEVPAWVSKLEDIDQISPAVFENLCSWISYLPASGSSVAEAAVCNFVTGNPQINTVRNIQVRLIELLEDAIV